MLIQLVKNLVSIALWIPALLFRLVLIVVGLFVVPFTDPETHPIYGNREDPVPRSWFMPGKPEWLRDYCWRALRNPTNNLRYMIEEPEVDAWYGDPDPDAATRKYDRKSAWRFSRAKLFSEFWYQRKCRDGEFFEFRFGWKFSNVPGFGMTYQLRKGM